MSKIVITIEVDEGFEQHSTRVWIADWVSKLVATAHIEKFKADITINADTDVILHKGYDC